MRLQQETVASCLGRSPKVFVPYIDVAKAFGTLWIDSQFYCYAQVAVECVIYVVIGDSCPIQLLQCLDHVFWNILDFQ